MKANTIKKVINFHNNSILSIRSISLLVKISRPTVSKIINIYKNSGLSYDEFLLLTKREITKIFLEKKKNPSKRYFLLISQLNEIEEKLKNNSYQTVWVEYKKNSSNPYSYSRFCEILRDKNILSEYPSNKKKLNIDENDIKALKKYKKSDHKKTWKKALVLLEIKNGKSISRVSENMNISVKTINKWIDHHNNYGLESLFEIKKKELSEEAILHIELKKKRIIELLHQPPSLFDINRTSWNLESLSFVYESKYQEKVSKTSISEYLKSEGYSFKKARKVLTSTDPEYREKLAQITSILQKLSEDEKFFSVDEYGPFAIKMQGGRSYTSNEEQKSYPQFQKSKGSLIITAALELSKNQITHFYSKAKNTDEMIKLINILLKEYNNETKLYLSWDAASWHMSKKLYEFVTENNKSNNILIELAPLPASAQFLNVIESVFSGMSRAIIHNSNYQSIGECKKSIDRYFEERNNHFKQNPKRAGNKIWGKELVEPVFNSSNNCKDPRYR